MRPFIFTARLMLLSFSVCAEQAIYAVEKNVQGRTLEHKPLAAPAAQGKPAANAGKPKRPLKPAGSDKYYLVKPGETLYSISVATGIGREKIAEWNALPASNLVKSGQRLKLFPPSLPAARVTDQRPSTGIPPAIENKVAAKISQPSGSTTPIKITALPDSITMTPLSGQDLHKIQPLPSEGNKKLSKPLGVTHKINNNPIKSSPRPSETAVAKQVLVDKKDKKPLMQTLKQAPAISLNKPASTQINPNLKIKKPDISINNKKMLKLNFQWPIKGIVLKKFYKTPAAGIDIASRQDKQKVNAAESGKVVYQGRGLQGYENLIVIKHNDDYVSIYANNSRLLVIDGQQVTKGQAIAEILAAGGQQKPLHFEIRKNGQAVEPLSFLPKR